MCKYLLQIATGQQHLASGNWLKGFALALGLVLAPLANAAEQIIYYHFDALGSPVAASDATGNYYLWKETYRPYGERIQKQPNSVNNTRWYTGKPQDDETGLSYFGVRYYDSVIGRFMGVDPVNFVETNPHSFNRYAYGNNNPYKYIDPDGRAAVLALIPPVVIGGAYIYYSATPEQRAQMGRAVTQMGHNFQSNMQALGDRIRSLTGPIFSENNEGANSGDKDPSTPTGQRGSPLEVKPGTNDPANIGGRDYTGHALDRMQGRGVPPSAVEDAIQNGKSSPGRGDTTVHTGSNGVTVVTGDGGRVITVIPK